MEIVSLLFLFLIPLLTLIFTLRFKGFMSILILAPTAMLLASVIVLSTDPTITILGTTSSTSGSSSGSGEHLEHTDEENVIITNSPVYHYNIQSGITIESLRNVVLSNIATGEQIDGGSSTLIGKKIQCIDYEMRRVGNPVGTINVGTFSSLGGNTIINPFGSIDASSLTPSFTFYTFCLAEGAEAIGALTHVFGATYNSGTLTNYVETRRTTTDVMDGGATRYSEILFGNVVWADNAGQDHNMKLYDNIPTVITRTTYFYEPCCSNSTGTSNSTSGGNVTYTLSGEVATVVYGMTFVVGGLLIFLVFRRVTGAINRENL